MIYVRREFQTVVLNENQIKCNTRYQLYLDMFYSSCTDILRNIAYIGEPGLDCLHPYKVEVLQKEIIEVYDLRNKYRGRVGLIFFFAYKKLNIEWINKGEETSR